MLENIFNNKKCLYLQLINNLKQKRNETKELHTKSKIR